MATTTNISDRVERSLNALTAEVDWLPNTVTDWDTISEGEQISTLLDWDHLLIDYLTELDVSYALDEMTAAQRERYGTLLRKLRDSLPLFARIGIAPPRIPLRLAALPQVTVTADEIDAQLYSLTVETASLPERLHRAIMNLDRKDDRWQFDWDGFAARLRGLACASRSGTMTREQQERYRALRDFLSEYLSFLRLHGFDTESVRRVVRSPAAD